MTATTVRRSLLRPPHRPLLVLTVAAAILTALTLVGLVADPRQITGAAAWLKPFKFAVSFVAYAGTLAWILAALPRRNLFAEWAATVVVGTSVVELAIIVLQAARGTTSHYNEHTPFDALLWQLMGQAVGLLFLAHLALGVVALLQRIEDRPFAYAVRAGLLLALLGMLAAVPMVTPWQGGGIVGAHTVGGPDGGPGLPLTGWSTTGGDLRIGHFVGMHGLQAMPLLALLLARTGLAAGVRARLVLVAAVAWALLTALLTWQAIGGRPLLHPDATDLTGLGALVAATAVAVLLVTRKRQDPEISLIRSGSGDA